MLYLKRKPNQWEDEDLSSFFSKKRRNIWNLTETKCNLKIASSMKNKKKRLRKLWTKPYKGISISEKNAIHQITYMKCLIPSGAGLWKHLRSANTGLEVSWTIVLVRTVLIWEVLMVLYVSHVVMCQETSVPNFVNKEKEILKVVLSRLKFYMLFCCMKVCTIMLLSCFWSF